MYRVLCVLLLWMAAPAVVPAADDYHRCAPDGIGVAGFDLVSYHQHGGPQRGLAVHSTEAGGLEYRFASDANLQVFLADPDKYLPVYRGWCAATLSMGRLACPDYTNFKIEDGRLLLFELAGFTNGRTLWDSDPVGFRRRADDNARKLLTNP